MSKKLLLFLFLTGVLVGIIGYSTGLTNWIQHYSGEASNDERISVLAELMALLVYTYFGVRFFNRRIIAQV